jgi:hypothetical protein
VRHIHERKRELSLVHRPSDRVGAEARILAGVDQPHAMNVCRTEASLDVRDEDPQLDQAIDQLGVDAGSVAELLPRH